MNHKENGRALSRESDAITIDSGFLDPLCIFRIALAQLFSWMSISFGEKTFIAVYFSKSLL
jgi:hypothetical protein